MEEEKVAERKGPKLLEIGFGDSDEYELFIIRKPTNFRQRRKSHEALQLSL